MNYSTGEDFRRALETRLRTISLHEHSSLTRLRKLVAFDRFLARLEGAQPGAWVLKGGLALQLRLGDLARVTKDMDFLLIEPVDNLHTLLVDAASSEQNDWFGFQVERPLTDKEQPGRFHVHALLDGRPFELFHVDVGTGDAMLDSVEKLSMPPLLAFAGISPTIASCFPVTQQIAEKLHAYTRPYGTSESSRVKDMVDILLLASLYSISGANLLKAIQATFETRQMQPLPQNLPQPPANWAPSIRKMASETQLAWNELDLAFEALRAFLDPVFGKKIVGNWDPVVWKWETL